MKAAKFGSRNPSEKAARLNRACCLFASAAMKIRPQAGDAFNLPIWVALATIPL